MGFEHQHGVPVPVGKLDVPDVPVGVLDLPVGQLYVWVDLKLSHIRVVDHNHRVPHLYQSKLK